MVIKFNYIYIRHKSKKSFYIFYFFLNFFNYFFDLCKIKGKYTDKTQIVLTKSAKN
jgi:hypothetical protein